MIARARGLFRAESAARQGEIEVDQSAMTGESLPVKFHPGEVRHPSPCGTAR